MSTMSTEYARFLETENYGRHSQMNVFDRRWYDRANYYGHHAATRIPRFMPGPSDAYWQRQIRDLISDRAKFGDAAGFHRPEVVAHRTSA